MIFFRSFNNFTCRMKTSIINTGHKNWRKYHVVGIFLVCRKGLCHCDGLYFGLDPKPFWNCQTLKNLCLQVDQLFYVILKKIIRNCFAIFGIDLKKDIKYLNLCFKISDKPTFAYAFSGVICYCNCCQYNNLAVFSV